MSTQTDYAAFQEAPTEDAFRTLTQLADRQVQAELALSAAETEVVRRKEALRQICEVELPTHMRDVLGLTTVTLRDGRVIAVEENIQANITEANKTAAFAWLEGNKHGNLIKNTIGAAFVKGEDEKAKKAIKALEDLQIEVEVKRAVHASTLKAFVKQQLRDGMSIPEELFGVHKQTFTTVKAKG